MKWSHHLSSRRVSLVIAGRNRSRSDALIITLDYRGAEASKGLNKGKEESSVSSSKTRFSKLPLAMRVSEGKGKR